MENKKQAAISNAYGPSYYAIKQFIDDDGWYKWSEECPVSLVISEFDYNKQTDCHRPKDLRGIENNNGWLHIDLENLPKEGFFYMGAFKNDGEFYTSYDEVEFDELSEYYFDCGFTHYQPIVKPLPPIY